jgi:hypothetical protein
MITRNLNHAGNETTDLHETCNKPDIKVFGSNLPTLYQLNGFEGQAELEQTNEGVVAYLNYHPRLVWMSE